MNIIRTLALTAAAFGGGYVVGLLSAPHSGRRTRELLGQGAQQRLRWAEARLHDLEQDLVALEAQLVGAGVNLGDRVREATHHAVEHHLPVPPEEDFSVDDGEVARELPHLPRR